MHIELSEKSSEEIISMARGLLLVYQQEEYECSVHQLASAEVVLSVLVFSVRKS